MRACVVTCGTNGDLRPFLAIASALARAGHSVHMMHSQGGSLSALCAATAAQLPPSSFSADELFGPDVEASLREHGSSGTESWVLPSTSQDFKTTAAALYSFFYSSVGEAARQVLEQCTRIQVQRCVVPLGQAISTMILVTRMPCQANIIVASSLALPFAHAAAEAAGIPLALVDLQLNWLPTREAAVAGSHFPKSDTPHWTRDCKICIERDQMLVDSLEQNASPAFYVPLPRRTLENWHRLNWKSFHFALQVSLPALEPYVGKARMALGLEEIQMDNFFAMIVHLPYLMAWDPHLYPHPDDYPKLYPRTYPCGYLPLEIQNSQVARAAIEKTD